MTRIGPLSGIGGGSGLSAPTVRFAPGATTTQISDFGNIVVHTGSTEDIVHILDNTHAAYYTIINGSDQPVTLSPLTGTISGQEAYILPPQTLTRPGVTVAWNLATTDWVIVSGTTLRGDAGTTSDVSGELVALAAGILFQFADGATPVIPSPTDYLYGFTPTPDLGVTPGVPWVGLVSNVTGSGLIVGNRRTASYALLLSDLGKEIEMNLAGANTLTVPLNATVPWPINGTVSVLQYGTGVTTITPESGSVTIQKAASSLVMAGQWSQVLLRKLGTNEWVASGGLI